MNNPTVLIPETYIVQRRAKASSLALTPVQPYGLASGELAHHNGDYSNSIAI